MAFSTIATKSLTLYRKVVTINSPFFNSKLCFSNVIQPVSGRLVGGDGDQAVLMLVIEAGRQQLVGRTD
jgi:hypothetical protein